LLYALTTLGIAFKCRCAAPGIDNLPGRGFALQTICPTIDLLRNKQCVIPFSARRSINARRVLMRTKFLLALIIFSSLTFWGADKLTPLNIKEGLWEMTVTHSMTGMPAIPPDTLAKMTPEQRARIEAATRQSGMGGPTADVHKECVTKEKLDKQSAFSDNRKECTRTVLNSTGSKLEIKVHCEEKQSSTDATLLLEAASSDNVKGSMQSVTNTTGRTMNMNFTFSSRYLGPACGDVK
jgi:hypothetical protein